MNHMLYSYKDIEQITLLAADKHLRRWLDCYAVLLVVEGKGELDISGSKVLLNAGTIYSINRGHMIEIHSHAHTDLYFYMLSFNIFQQVQTSQAHVQTHVQASVQQPLTQQSLSQTGTKTHQVSNQTQTEILTQKQGHNLHYISFDQQWLPDGEQQGTSFIHINGIMKELCALAELPHEWKELDRQRLLYELLSLVLQPNLTLSSSQAEHHQRIEYVIRYMQQHYNESLTRDAMAKLVGFHPRFFTKVFKEQSGHNFIEYLTSIRIQKAKELILLSTQTLDAIAQQVGYSNGLYLSRKFKEYTGISPSHYVQTIKRIVVYDWVGNVLALGIKPVGASYFYSIAHLELLKNELSGVVDVGRGNIELVASLEPELIIVPKWLESSTIRELQRVAPTLIIPYGNPFERFRQLAELLHRKDEAEQFIKQYEKRAAEVKIELSSIIKEHETVGLYELSEQHIWVLNEFHGRGGYNLYEGIGLKPPLSVQADVIGKGQIKRLELDQLPDYAADHMIISYNYDDEGFALAKKHMAHPVWQQVEAFRNKRIYTIDRRIFHANDVYSLYHQLELQRQLFQSSAKDAMFVCP